MPCRKSPGILHFTIFQQSVWVNSSFFSMAEMNFLFKFLHSYYLFRSTLDYNSFIQLSWNLGIFCDHWVSELTILLTFNHIVACQLSLLMPNWQCKGSWRRQIQIWESCEWTRDDYLDVVMLFWQVELDAADCAILRMTPTFICSGDTSGNVRVCHWYDFILITHVMYSRTGVHYAAHIL